MTAERTYDHLVGRRYGMLTVTEALPRERGASGKLNPARVKCHCDCGNDIDIKVNTIISGKQKSCGCVKRGRKPIRFGISGNKEDYMDDETPVIVKRLHAVWKCPNGEGSGCIRNEASKLCCRECDKFCSCDNACKNFPSACGAEKWHANVMSVNPNENQVTERCPNCDNDVTLVWDVAVDGFKAFCPYCGERLMLCSECQHRFEGGDFTDDCDYDIDTDSCRFNRYSYGVKERYIATVRNKLTKRTLLEQMAEEANELGKACMKCIRAEGLNENYTPVSSQEAHSNVLEEFGDICTVAEVLGLKKPDSCRKLERWTYRLMEVKHESKEISEEN